MTNRVEKPEDLLPLTPAVYNVLLALGEGPLHGYAIIQEFERKTGQVGALLPGSLYNTIARMLKLGVIEETAGPAAGEDERRRYYQVTAFGKRVAQAESFRLQQLLKLAEASAYLVEPS